ncbi:PEX5-related protein [Platysternon megacephalum]|uniref:Zona pellucida sperm-binding protein 3 n=1 Tax=Platysternon megacephalum TaxID=55544 RepID=A0A4D9E4T2_9SAUR|nr:PEX5-related protein [Platysternon megacephalum]
MTPDSLVYSTSLNYNPTPASNPVILRTSPAVIPIECHYPRKDNVSSKAIKPTWVPFSSTLSAEERLGFSLRLMNDDWSAERPSNGFQLWEVMHIQADVSTGNHVALRLFVDSCVATLTPDRDSSPRYAVIDFNGTSLNYNPTPASNPVILRTSPAVIPIECHYPRKDNVSSKAIKPTWVPFSSTLSAEERLGFSLRLMNDDWSAERPSNGFQLWEVMHIQADVSTGNHVALRLFVDSCVATLTPDRDSSPRYAVIDFNG